MQQSLLISIIAEDKPGIVESLANIIAQHNGNWLESKMARLGGQFTGIVQVDINEKDLAPLSQALKPLESQGITLSLTTSNSDTELQDPSPVSFKVTGDDRPGIVQELSTLMANCGANIEEFATYIAGAPFSGGVLFTMEGCASLPPTLKKWKLAEKMESLSDDLMVEIDAK